MQKVPFYNVKERLSKVNINNNASRYTFSVYL